MENNVEENTDLFEGVTFGMPSDGDEDNAIDLAEVNVDPEQSDDTNEEKDPVIIDSSEDNIDNKDKKAAVADDDVNKLDLVDINADADADVDEDKKKAPDSEKGSSPVTPFASFLQEKGFLPNFDEDKFNDSENPIDALADAMNEEIKIANAGFINSFPPELIDMARAVAAGVPFEALQGAKMQEINYSKITEDSIKGDDNIDLQKRIVSDALLMKGFKENKIFKMIERLEDAGELENEAMDYKDELVQVSKQRQEQVKKDFEKQQQQMSQQQQDYVAFVGQSIDKMDEFIPGVKMGKVAKDKLFNNMTQMVAKDANGNPVNYTMNMRSQNPVQFDLAVTYLADLTKGFTDWSKIGKGATSNAAKKLEQTLSKTSTEHTYGSAKKAPASLEDTDESSLMASLMKEFGATD